MEPYFQDEKSTIYNADCRDALKEIPDNSIDAIVTDPPYELGFMGKSWDKSGIANDVVMWRECLRVLKPGGYLLSFGGSRTYHRMACSIEDAGFEIRDQIMWLYGSGFPKSLDVGKAIDKAARGVPQGGSDPTSVNHGKFKGGCSEENPEGRGFGAGPGKFMAEAGEKLERKLVDSAKQWQGWGTALKPAHEPICVARKPIQGTVAANVQWWGTGALNIDGCRIEGPMDGVWGSSNKTVNPDRTFVGSPDAAEYKTTPHAAGRWPANVIHDGSEEVVSRFPSNAGAAAPVTVRNGDEFRNTYGAFAGSIDEQGSTFHADSGSAARFFKTCKLSEYESLLCRAKAIMVAWNPDLANTASTSLSLSKSHAASVLSDAVTVASRGEIQLRNLTGLSMNVTLIELKTLCENAIAMILNFGKRSWPASFRLDMETSKENPVNHVETPRQIATMMTTTSHTNLDGCAVVVTLDSTQNNMEAGEAGYPSSAYYTAKADRWDRDEGLEGLEGLKQDPTRKEGNPGGDNPRNRGVHVRNNHHPTVKPTDLMRYLCRLVTQPGGIVLDPFMGSGSTRKAALKENDDYALDTDSRIWHSRDDVTGQRNVN